MQHVLPTAAAKSANVVQGWVTSLGLSWSAQSQSHAVGSWRTKAQGITHVADVDAAGVPTAQAKARASGNSTVSPNLAEVVLELHEVALVGRGEDAALRA